MKCPSGKLFESNMSIQTEPKVCENFIAKRL